jgi:hypothetical protein
MDLNRLYAILRDTTVQLRKGAEVEHERVGPVDVTHVWAMPHESEAPPSMEKVDCALLTVAVDKARAETVRADLVALLADYPEPDRLAGGPSYIEVGAVIGDQGAAFQLFALGAVLGLWTVITPRTLGFTDDTEVRAMAGRGLVMMSGYRGGQPPPTNAIDPHAQPSGKTSPRA